MIFGFERSKMEKKLKNYSPSIISLLIFNVVLLYGKRIYLYIDELIKDNEIFFDEKFIVISLMPIITFIIIHIVPTPLKNIIIFTRIKNPLPGSRVFSKLIINDDRINYAEAVNKYNMHDIKKNDENSKWYKIYMNHRNNSIVYASHRIFLKARDMTTAIIVLLIVFLITSILFSGIYSHTKLIFLVIEVILLMIVTRNLANRFVVNVIAVDLNEKG